MTLTIDDAQTLISLIEQNQTLRQQIKKAIFPELDIENTLQRLTRLLERMDNRIAAQETALTEFKEETRQNFAEAKSERQRLERKMDTGFAEAKSERERLERKMDTGFAEAKSERERLERKVDTGFAEVRADIAELRHDVGKLKGESKEAFYHRRAAAIFGRYVSKGREVSNQVADQLQIAFNQNLITDDEYEQTLAADMFWGGNLRQTNDEVVLVMEASWYAQIEDVQRAADRAAIGQRAGLSTIPVVGGEDWSAEATALATERAVAMLVDGRLKRASWQRAVEQWLSDAVA